MSHSWENIRNQVREFRSELTSIYPAQVLSTYRDFYIYNDTLYFLSNNQNNGELTPSRYLSMYKVDLTQCKHLILFVLLLLIVFVVPTSLLKNTLAFSEYIEEKGTTRPIQGVSTMSITENIILFTFQNSIYMGHPNSVKRKQRDDYKLFLI